MGGSNGAFRSVADEVVAVLTEAMELDSSAYSLGPDTALLGGLPEFDSMTLLIVITALEERFDITVEEDEINESVFETVATLTRYVESKLSHA